MPDVIGTVTGIRNGQVLPSVYDSVNNALRVSGDATDSTAALANGAETAVAGSAVQVLAANPARRALIIQNTGVANVRVGIAGVAATTGFRLVPGDTLVLDSPAVPKNAIFAIREGGTSSTVLAQEVAG